MRLNVSSGTAGLLVTATQAGYVAGLILIVPLGDRLQRRRLVSRLLVIDALALAGAPPRRRFGMLAAALASSACRASRRRSWCRSRPRWPPRRNAGRVVGRVMSGLLLGILLARTVAGVVAELGGWRLIYGLAAGAMLILALVLRRALPDVEPPGAACSLRRAAALGRRADPRGADAAAADGVRLPLDGRRSAGFWTSIAFLLSGPEYGYSEAVIGLFSLAGLAGAAMASLAGRVADARPSAGGHAARRRRRARGWGLLALGAALARPRCWPGSCSSTSASRPRRSSTRA